MAQKRDPPKFHDFMMASGAKMRQGIDHLQPPVREPKLWAGLAVLNRQLESNCTQHIAFAAETNAADTHTHINIHNHYSHTVLDHTICTA